MSLLSSNHTCNLFNMLAFYIVALGISNFKFQGEMPYINVLFIRYIFYLLVGLLFFYFCFFFYPLVLSNVCAFVSHGVMFSISNVLKIIYTSSVLSLILLEVTNPMKIFRRGGPWGLGTHWMGIMRCLALKKSDNHFVGENTHGVMSHLMGPCHWHSSRWAPQRVWHITKCQPVCWWKFPHKNMFKCSYSSRCLWRLETVVFLFIFLYKLAFMSTPLSIW